MIRQEIKEGMRAYIKVCSNKPDIYTPEMCAEDLMEYLDSQDVVIKLNRELPEMDITTAVLCNGICHRKEQENMLKWHNESLESLIEEKHE